MLWAFIHDLEHLFDEAQWYLIVKQVAHRIHENYARFSPSTWDVQRFMVATHGKTIGIFGNPHCLQSSSHHFSIAILAASRNFVAASGGIPSEFSPFYGACGHGKSEEVDGDGMMFAGVGTVSGTVIQIERSCTCSFGTHADSVIFLHLGQNL